MLTLYTFPPTPQGAPSASPFCVKAMIWLAWSGQAWRAKSVLNPSRMPHKKLPVLQTDKGMIADSAAIADYLQQLCGRDLDADLNAQQRAQAHSLSRLAEDTLYFALVAERWQNPQSWQALRQAFFSSMPAPLRPLVAPIIRRQVLRDLHGQGTGRFTAPQRYQRVRADLEALETLAPDDQGYWFGPQPSSLDFALLPQLSAISQPLIADSPLAACLAQQPKLSAYVQRGHAQLIATLSE